ncbi:MAG TPA: tetratricopeptide repeat protein [Gemmatimonadales bacterium]|nr:tetratricopeptide repeat protein [Gemmatimonadales bacterium]
MRTLTMTMGAGLLCAAAGVAFGQSFDELRKMYDAGKYQQVIAAAASDDENPRATYLAALSHQKLRHADEARRAYAQLAGRPESDPWRDIGRSAVALLSSDPAGAVDAANQAVASDDSLPEAHYQRGLALSARQDMAGAAAAFQKASDLDPGWAHAHYYAGIAYSKVKRADLTASHFQTFLKLAPDAPERPEVESILRTLGKH